MLAENDDPKFLKGSDLFEMEYGWKLHHLLNEIAQGKKTLEDFDALMRQLGEIYESDDIMMNFVTNHDENSWAGTVKERLGDASELMTAVTYMVPGMPLIYSGQEYDMEHRLKFFEKDSIPKTRGTYFEILKKLGKLKNSNKALNGGKNAANYKRLESTENILMYERNKDGDTVLFIGNFSNKPHVISIPNGKYLDYMAKASREFKNDTIKINPWDYKILIR